MEIIKEENGKWIRPAYGNYLTQTSTIDDKDRLIVKEVYIHPSESTDLWEEITQKEVERIIKAKKAAQGEIIYPEVEVNLIINLFASQINNIEINDIDAIKFKNLYPDWINFIGLSLKKDFKINYNGNLYKTLQEIVTVLDQQGYRPGEIGSESLYVEINETNKGTFEDPIPYNNMQLYLNKYYSQNGTVYKCIRDTELPIYNDLNTLIGIYVELM